MVNIERAGGARKISVLSIIGIILVPVIIAGGFVWAVWHAGDRMDNVSAAIVNNDEPVKVDGNTVPLGRQLASGLVTGDDEAGSSDENYNWQITDQDDAKSGLKSGKYAVVVTIPDNFSSAATSYSKKDGDKARHATLDVTTSNVTGVADPAVSSMIASAATKSLNSNLTKSYLKNIYVGFNDIGQQFSKVADSASDLADGEDKLGKGIHKTHHGAKGLADGLDKLDSGADGLASGADDLESGANGLSSGADDLASGADDLASGEHGLANGLNKLDKKTSSLPGQTQKLANGAQQLSSASGKVAGGVDQLASAVHGVNTKLQSAVSDSSGNAGDAAAGVQKYANGVNQYVDSVQQMADNCQQQGGDPAFCQKLKKVAAQGSGFQSKGKQLSDGVSKMANGLDQLPELAAGVNTLDSKVSKLADGADGVSSGAGSLASGTQKLANGMGPLSKGVSQSADGADKLANGADKLSNGAGQLSNGAGKLANGADGLADGAHKLADGTHKSAHGAHKLAGGIGDLSDSHEKLADGTHKLADGLAKGADNVPSYSKSQRQQLSKVVSAPVSSPTSNSSSIFADASAAGFLIAIALWIGALVTYLVIRAVTSRVLTSSRPSWLLALRGLIPGMIAIAAQAVLVTGLLGIVMDLSFGVLAELFLFSLLAGAAFVAVNHALVALLGGIGRFISVILVVLTAASNVLSAVPQFFATIAPFLPLTPAINGLRAIAGDGSGIGAAAGGLLAWIVLGVAASIIAVVRRRSASPDGVGHPVLS